MVVLVSESFLIGIFQDADQLGGLRRRSAGLAPCQPVPGEVVEFSYSVAVNGKIRPLLIRQAPTFDKGAQLLFPRGAQGNLVAGYPTLGCSFPRCVRRD